MLGYGQVTQIGNEPRHHRTPKRCANGSTGVSGTFSVARLLTSGEPTELFIGLDQMQRRAKTSRHRTRGYLHIDISAFRNVTSPDLTRKGIGTPSVG